MNELSDKVKSFICGDSIGQDFDSLVLEVFRYQANQVPVYRDYLKLLDVDPYQVKSIDKIPFLPAALFKNHKIHDNVDDPVQQFISSGTTGSVTSLHYVADPSLYELSLMRGFVHFYGNPEQWVILALLPSYLERDGSSLVFMADLLIRESKNSESGFYLNQYSDLNKMILQLHGQNRKVLLLGVTYALLDLFEGFPVKIPELVIMETGGMKGKRKEMVRSELHTILQQKSGTDSIHSEYGMTELLSQAYSNGFGIFKCPPWMKVFVRDRHDPLGEISRSGSGIVQVIDLANLHSCSFISTQDIGRCYQDGSFEILGRTDDSDIRGCNLMVE